MNVSQINPYAKPTSVAAKAFELAKAGTTRAKIVMLCETAEVGPARILRELKLEDFRQIKWTYTESEDGSIKISEVKATKGTKVAKPAKEEPKVEAKAAPVKKLSKLAKEESKQADRREAKAKKAEVKAAAALAPKVTEAEIKAAHAKAEAATGRCGHCGVAGHKESTCQLAKQAKAELAKEAKRRKAVVQPTVN